MEYKVYYKGSKVKTFYKGDLCVVDCKTPEDVLSISVSGDILTYSISNPSERTQYLYDMNSLGLAIFVEENPGWIGANAKWRSNFAKTVHKTRRIVQNYSISSLSGTINLNTIGTYHDCGCTSRQLYYPFNYSAAYQDPYKETGVERVTIGIGRTTDKSNFRPYKVGKYIEIEVTNRM